MLAVLVFLPIAFLFFLGLAVGSFMNVVILRFGYRESSAARSHCMSCNAQIKEYDLIPVISFLFLKGRCRSCGSTLSWQYPLVELLMGVLFVLVYLTVPPVFAPLSIGAFIALLLFIASLVALTVYDMRHTLVPMPFVYAIYTCAFVATAAQSLFMHSVAPLEDGALGAIALAGFFFLIYFITRGRGMGLGDAYVAGAIGLILGFVRGIESVMFAFWIGTPVYLLILLLSSMHAKVKLLPRFMRVTMKSELPFVPFLALGALLAIVTTLSPLAFGAWLSHTLWFSGQ